MSFNELTMIYKRKIKSLKVLEKVKQIESIKMREDAESQ